VGVVDLFLRWHRKEYSFAHKFVASALGLTTFVFLVPWGLLALSDVLERAVGIPRLVYQPVNIAIGAVVALLGLAFAGWTVLFQLTLGRGTPVPVVPPKKLLVAGPYEYCRNPMVMGYIAYCFGLSVWFGSVAMLLLSCVLWGLGAVYIKKVEEKELEARFGEEYRKYKAGMPMFIPRLRKGR